jgi:hypothetical protein
VVLVEDPRSERFKIEIRNLWSVREAVGLEVLTQFCRCFVQADRLTSLISFQYLSSQFYKDESVAYSRNLQTMVWFTLGRCGRRLVRFETCEARSLSAIFSIPTAPRGKRYAKSKSME